MNKPTITDIAQAIAYALATFTPEARAEAFVSLNKWEWPESLAQFKPEGYDELDAEAKRKDHVGDIAMRCVKDVTTAFSRSRAWWTIQLGRTEEEHSAWWASNAAEFTSAEKYHAEVAKHEGDTQ